MSGNTSCSELIDTNQILLPIECPVLWGLHSEGFMDSDTKQSVPVLRVSCQLTQL